MRQPHRSRALSTVDPSKLWNNPGTDPHEIGEYNATVFDPLVLNPVHAHTPGKIGFRTIYVRYWNGKVWSRPYLLQHSASYKRKLRSQASTLTGDHARYWWRDVKHLQGVSV